MTIDRAIAARVLIVSGVVLAALAWFLWQRASDAAERENRVDRLVAAIDGERFDENEPDRAGPTAVGAIAGVMFLSGVILAASSPSQQPPT